jgi:hypothetical protein
MEAGQEQSEATESSQGDPNDEDLQPETSQPQKVGGFGCWGGGRLLRLATPSAATSSPTQVGGHVPAALLSSPTLMFSLLEFSWDFSCGFFPVGLVEARL